MRCWRLDGGGQTLVLASPDGGLPHVVWWGAVLDEAEDLEALARAAQPDVTGGMLDTTAPVSLCPESGRAFAGYPGLIARVAFDGRPLTPIFALSAVEKGPDGVIVTARDDAEGLHYTATVKADAETGMLVLQARLEAEVPILLDWLAAPVLPAPAHSPAMIDFAGRWCGEFQPVRIDWTPGARLRRNPTGRTGHEAFPGLLVLSGKADTDPVWQMHCGWSGGHQMVAEQLSDGRRQVQFGHAPGSERAPGTRFDSAPLYAAYAQNRAHAARVFQRHLRDRIVTWPDSARPRPVHYNCWEAVYFDHDDATLRDIATRAARLGAERFVLDDGWFGRRDDDTSSLGDWVIDRRKWPDGLAPFADHVHALGMQFGLWVEPEMVNPGSDLARAHPDWILGRADQPLGRNQLVLDMARSDVRDYLFNALSPILRDTGAAYVKWDHNRVLPHPDVAQTEGTYALIDRLRASHPGVEWESCASGGGRIDYGMLSRTSRVWLSDSNDALERQRIQHWAAQFLPGAVTGSHVGPRVCHTSGRVLPMEFRAWTAAQRHMGFEMDPRELTPEEEATLTSVVTWWKANRDWLMGADILPLPSDDPAVLAELHLSADESRFVAFAARIDSPKSINPNRLRLTGLPDGTTWSLRQSAPGNAQKLSRATPAVTDGLTLSARALGEHGVTLPWDFPCVVHVIEGWRA